MGWGVQTLAVVCGVISKAYRGDMQIGRGGRKATTTEKPFTYGSCTDCFTWLNGLRRQ